MNTSIYLWGCTCIPLKGGILHRYRLPLYLDTGQIQVGYRYRLEGIRSIKSMIQRVKRTILGLGFIGLFSLLCGYRLGILGFYGSVPVSGRSDTGLDTVTGSARAK